MSRAALISGLAVLALAWATPLLGAWRESVFAHMLAHMAVVALAAPLLAIGIGPFLPRADTSARARPTLLSLPVVASLVELIVVWGWHAPAARAFAEGSLAGTVVEQVTFLAAGLLLWSACLHAPAREGGAAAGAFGLLLTTVHMTLLGALLALSPRPLYGAGDVTCFGTVLSAAQDQQLAGVAMLLLGAAAYLAGGLALLGRVLNAAPQEARR